ncbi:MAG: 3-dehydroquinate synthase [Saprospiraceae bacterium]
MSSTSNNIKIQNHIKPSNSEGYTIFPGTLAKSWKDWFSQRSYSSIFILVDENTKEKCLPVFLAKTEIHSYLLIEIESGESNKTISTCEKIWSQMMKFSADRKSLCINLGGGVIGDMGGFCASTYKRGIDFVQVPTTLLAQVDASIGGKLGIDFNNIKNGIGIFQNPVAVFIDIDFLASLPERELKSGFAEMLKHALISSERDWALLSKELPEVNAALIYNIANSLKIKKAFIDKDPFEENIRKALNFGHTIGHAIESYYILHKNPILHGEAIAIGIVCESYLSAIVLGFPIEQLEKIVLGFSKIFPKVELPENSFDYLIELMHQDKKNEKNFVNFTLLLEIGKAKINQYPDKILICNSLKYYLQNYPD